MSIGGGRGRMLFPQPTPDPSFSRVVTSTLYDDHPSTPEKRVSISTRLSASTNPTPLHRMKSNPTDFPSSSKSTITTLSVDVNNNRFDQDLGNERIPLARRVTTAFKSDQKTKPLSHDHSSSSDDRMFAFLLHIVFLSKFVFS
jgi:hypothetical protein